jgi:hypothetical protein
MRMRRITQAFFVLSVFVIGLELRAAVSTGYQAEEVVAPVKVSADSVLVEPSPLPPTGIREPLPGRTRAITHGPVPHDLPIPPGAKIFLESQLPATATSPTTSPMPMSPAPSSSFLALPDGAPTIQMIPPDTQGAVGTDRLMAAANSQVRIQQRDGSVVNTYALNSFFGSSAGGSGVYDPVVNYDPYSSRWILVACDDPVLTTSALLISASDSTNPDGNFRVWRFTADSTGVLWADRPHVGFNKDWLVIQINMYTMSASTYAGSNIYACPKTTLYAGGTMSCTLWKTTTIGASQVPVRTLDSSVGAVYLVQAYNNDSSGTASLGLYSITGSVGSEILNTIGYPSTSATWSYNSSSDLGPQAGSGNHIDLADHRMLDAVYRNGFIWASHTVFLPAGGYPTRAAAQWWQLSTSGSIIQRGRIDDSSGVSSFAYPSLAVNKDNAVLLGFSSFSANTFAGAAYAFRKSSDPASSMQSTVLLKGGEAPYYKTFGGTKNRWGDYSSTVVDPVNDTDMWTIQEYAAAPGGGTYPDRWSTWWGRVVPSSGGGSTGGPCTPDAQTLCLHSSRFKVTVSYVAGGTPGNGNAVKLPGTDDSGYFWFFDPNNMEVVAKIASFCSSSGQYGFYVNGLTDLQLDVTLTDTKDGTVWHKVNTNGTNMCKDARGGLTCP